VAKFFVSENAFACSAVFRRLSDKLKGISGSSVTSSEIIPRFKPPSLMNETSLSITALSSIDSPTKNQNRRKDNY
jgi:hypothetical protein